MKETVPLSNAERQARYRQRKRESNATSNDRNTVTKTVTPAATGAAELDEVARTPIPAVLRTKSPRRSTHQHGAVSLLRSNPALHNEIVTRLKSGEAIREVARVTGVSRSQVGQMALEELGPDFRRGKVGQDLWELASRCADTLLDEVDKLPASQRAILLGICCDKLSVMSAKPETVSLTQNNLNLNVPVLTSDQFEKLLSAATVTPTAPSTVTTIDL